MASRSILDCPAELIDIIIQFLSLPDIQSFRLTCRSNQQKSFTHFQDAFTCKVISLDPEDLHNLLCIARNNNFGPRIEKLVIKFHDRGMIAAHRCLASMVFTGESFVEPDVHAKGMLSSGVFMTGYFERAIKTHRPDGSSRVSRFYRHGHMLTDDMVDRCNAWVDMVHGRTWNTALSTLSSMTSIEIWDGTLDQEYIPMYADSQPHIWDLVATAGANVQEVGLHFNMGLLWNDRPMNLDTKQWNFPLNNIRKLSMDMATPECPFYGSSVPQIPLASIAQSLTNLTELYLYRKHRGGRSRIFRTINDATTIGSPHYDPTAVVFPNPRTLGLEKLHAGDIPISLMHRQPKLSTLILDAIGFCSLPNDKLYEVIHDLAHCARLEEIRVRDFQCQLDSYVLFRDSESVQAGEHETEAEVEQLVNFGPYMGSFIERRTELRIIRLMAKSGKKLRWGRPEEVVRPWKEYKHVAHLREGMMV